MRWWLCVVAALGAACDSSSSNLRVVAITTEGLAPGDDARASAVYCRYTSGQLDKDAPAEVGGRSICAPDPDDFRAAKLAPKGARLRVVFDKPLDSGVIARKGVASFEGDGPVRVTCTGSGGSIDVSTTFEYRADDPFGPTLVILPDLTGDRVPTSASCSLAVDRAVVDQGGTPVEPGSVFDVKVADLGLLSIVPVNDTDTVLAPVGAIAFTFNADLDENSLDDVDFRVSRGGVDVGITIDVPTAAEDIVHVFPMTPYPPGSYMASIRSNSMIVELNGGAFVFDPAGMNTFAFTVNDTVMTGIDVTTPDPSVPLGVPVPFTATATLSDGNTLDVTAMANWSSSNTQVATISNAAGSRGLATSLLQGNTTVTATVGAFTDTFALTIEAAALESIVVSPATASIPDGRSQPFTALGNFTDGNSRDITLDVTWQSSNTSIVTINNMGVASTTGNTMIGPVTITATQGTVSDTSTLTVIAAVVESITVTCDDADLAFPLGVDVQCTAVGFFSDGTNDDITDIVAWSSTPLTRVTVDGNGLVTTPNGATAGPGTITATLGLISDSVDVDVTDAVIRSVTISGPDGWSIPIGLTRQFSAIATYTDDTTCTVGLDCDVTTVATWTATPAGRITINAAGLASAPSGTTTGPVTVTATIGAVSDISVGSVAPAVLQSIVVTPDNISLPVGTTQQYTATGTFSDGPELDITNTATWTTSNGSFASVNPTGLVTSNTPGNVTITATQGTVSDTASLTTTPASAPEIGIEISSLPIPDADDDFVGARIVGQAFTRTYQVTNAGNANLTLGAITFPAQSNCTASVSTPPSTTTVGPSSSTTFVITVSPTAIGGFSCKFSIVNNDGNENPYDVDVRGIGVLDTGNFGDMDGIYDGDLGCDFGTFTLASNTAIVLANLIGNAPLTFLLTAASVASANGVVVFSIGNHICTITRNGAGFTITMGCSNSGGGSCSEQFSRRAAPEIEVRDVDANNFEVLNGYDGGFETLQPGESNAFWRLSIRNTGTAPLNLGTITITNELNCNGTVTVPPAMTTLAPGASTTTTIRFTPVTTGPFDCTVRIPSDDSDENPFVTGFTGDAL